MENSSLLCCLVRYKKDLRGYSHAVVIKERIKKKKEEGEEDKALIEAPRTMMMNCEKENEKEDRKPNDR
ncbi:unnamed protein product [Bathycoccus prasinos]